MSDPSAGVPRQTVLLWGWACALTACLVGPIRTVSAGPRGISLEYMGVQYERVLAIGNAYCARLGKEAWPADNTTVGDAYHHVQRFECRSAPPPRTAAVSASKSKSR